MVPDIVIVIIIVSSRVLSYCGVYAGLCLVAPFPSNFRQESLDGFNVMLDFDIAGGGEVWYARPPLSSMYTGTLCPTGALNGR